MTEKAPALVCIDGPEEDSFPVTITVRNLRGVASSITFDCIPRDVAEWAAEGDKIRAEVAERVKAEEAKSKKKDTENDAAAPILMEAMVTERIKSDAGVAMRIAKGWSVTDKFGAAAIAKMERKFPGAVRALHDGYTRVVNGEREGN